MATPRDWLALGGVIGDATHKLAEIEKALSESIIELKSLNEAELKALYDILPNGIVRGKVYLALLEYDKEGRIKRKYSIGTRYGEGHRERFDYFFDMGMDDLLDVMGSRASSKADKAGASTMYLARDRTGLIARKRTGVVDPTEHKLRKKAKKGKKRGKKG